MSQRLMTLALLGVASVASLSSAKKIKPVPRTGGVLAKAGPDTALGASARTRTLEVAAAVPMCGSFVTLMECAARAEGKPVDVIDRLFVQRYSLSAFRYLCARLLVVVERKLEQVSRLPPGNESVEEQRRAVQECFRRSSGVLEEAAEIARGPVPAVLQSTVGQLRPNDPAPAGGADSAGDPDSDDPPLPSSDSGGPPSPPSDSGGPPSPPASASDDGCARGQVSVAGHCCWPGQDWGASSRRCIGTPRCPVGTRASGETCVAGCPRGQVRVVGHCCWPGQDWGSSSQRCIGRPRCPRGTRRSGETCVR